MTGGKAAAPSGRRIAVASFVGTAIEFYDFYIYGTAAALVFGGVFFPSFSPLAGTLASLATFAVGFVARPLGAILFGHYGDRIGRKRMLIVSLVLMGTATVAVGLIPSYDTIGVLAPVLLVIARFAQGIGLGGEWGGAVLLATEYAPPGKRGLYSAFPQLGPSVGFILGNAMFLLLDATMSDETFESVGWRIPFLASAVLLVVGYYIRMRIAETPVFQAAVQRQDRSKVPFADLLRSQPKVLLLATLGFILSHTLFYTVTTFALSYGTNTLHVDRTTMLLAAMVAVAIMGVATLWFAVRSDRIGRGRICLASAVCAAVWAFPLFWLIDTRDPLLITLGMTGGLLCFAMLYGPMGAFLPELFRVRYRYSGASFAYSASGIIGGGVSPLVATALLDRTGTSAAVSVYVIGIAIVCLVSVAMLRETKDADFTDGMTSSRT
ncbi:MFS transporter [Pseudonocardia sp. MH-G8]|uniref:MFS transporter n=1 Tax=Pseudonocardia sp. MH-G8 TaxID=1854588 RepID=UPI000BA0A646|nr:MFS transporter [Pseudonocardia sp. MH-G8]OZM81618.1 MFS transporter [Pseudonocardia sp. MH-G8]